MLILSKLSLCTPCQGCTHKPAPCEQPPQHTEERAILAQLCFQVTLLGHVTHPVTTYWNTIPHQNRYVTNSPPTTQVPYPCPDPKYSTAELLPVSSRTQPHRHNVSSRGGWHFRSWEGGRGEKYILLFIHIAHGCFIQLWGIPCFLHKNAPRTKYLSRRAATVLQEEERRRAPPPTPHSTATSTLEALKNLLCNTYCFKME